MRGPRQLLASRNDREELWESQEGEMVAGLNGSGGTEEGPSAPP